MTTSEERHTEATEETGTDVSPKRTRRWHRSTWSNVRYYPASQKSKPNRIFRHTYKITPVQTTPTPSSERQGVEKRPRTGRRAAPRAARLWSQLAGPAGPFPHTPLGQALHPDLWPNNSLAAQLFLTLRRGNRQVVSVRESMPTSASLLPSSAGPTEPAFPHASPPKTVLTQPCESFTGPHRVYRNHRRMLPVLPALPEKLGARAGAQATVSSNVRTGDRRETTRHTDIKQAMWKHLCVYGGEDEKQNTSLPISGLTSLILYTHMNSNVLSNWQTWVQNWANNR